MTLSFNISSGTSDCTPRKHFIPHQLRQKSRTDSVTNEGTISFPIYKPILEFQHTLKREFPFNSRIIDDGTLVWFSVSEHETVKLNSMFYRGNKLQTGKSWEIEKICSKNSNRDQNLSTLVSLSPDLAFGVLVQHVKKNTMFKSAQNKFKISVLKFRIDKGFKLFRNIHTIKQSCDISHYVFCLSTKERYLAFAIVPSGQDYTKVTLFKIEYKNKEVPYDLKHVSEIRVNYYINSMKFSEKESTLILLGNKYFYVIYPLESAHPSQTKFAGCDPYMTYNRDLKLEYIFSQSKDNFNEVDIFQVKPDCWRSGNLLFDYKKIRNLQYDDLRNICGVKRVFYVHHYKNVTRLFLGFTHEVYVFDPFSCQCIFKLDLVCDHAAPFCYTLDANWSGKEVSIFCWDNLDFASLKIFHLGDGFDISLRKQALLVVQATYPLNILRTLNLPKVLLSMLNVT